MFSVEINFQHLPNATQKAKQAQLGSIQSRQAESLEKGGAAARPGGQMQYCRGSNSFTMHGLQKMHL